MHTNSQIQITPEAGAALQLMETGNKNIFLTGKAGTGKSTLLEYFRRNTQKQVVVLAPTGVAALNVQGQTIHSFFRFPYQLTAESINEIRPTKELLNILNKTDIIIIDEISMVRADLFDFINQALQLFLHSDEPFAGKKIIVVGDLYQLPPVVTREDQQLLTMQYATPYFFSAECFLPHQWDVIELETMFRQNESNFITLLNKIRTRQASFSDISWLNQQCHKPQQQAQDGTITLTTTNKKAAEINSVKLRQLPGQATNFSAKQTGSFSAKSAPTNENLALKPNAQIMMLTNDSQGRWVNGSIGKIITITNPTNQSNTSNGQEIRIQLENGKLVTVTPHTWELNQYKLDPISNKIETEIIGSFTQFPLKLAWAITIHKSQGKTFEKLNLDLGYGAFAHGQLYVALSRCRSFKGLQLQTPVKLSDVKINQAVSHFFNSIKNTDAW